MKKEYIVVDYEDREFFIVSMTDEEYRGFECALNFIDKEIDVRLYCSIERREVEE